jgi:thiol-disulfide isomerase/thioredoxin
MMTTVWLITLLWMRLSCVIAADVTQEPRTNGDVMELTGQTFERVVQETLTEFDAMLVQFYAPWCGHCRRFEPKLHNISKQLIGACKDGAKPGCVRVVRLNGDKEMAIALRFGVWGFPAFYGLVGNLQKPKRPDVFVYVGPHSEEALVSFGRKLAERQRDTLIPNAMKVDGWRHPFGPVLRLAVAAFVAPQKATSALSQLLTHWLAWGLGLPLMIVGVIYWRRKRLLRRHRVGLSTAMNSHTMKPE